MNQKNPIVFSVILKNPNSTKSPFNVCQLNYVCFILTVFDSLQSLRKTIFIPLLNFHHTCADIPSQLSVPYAGEFIFLKQPRLEPEGRQPLELG
jgi:hypothetical protein